MRTWVQAVEQATGRRPIIYTRASFWTTQSADFGDYPLWVAHYHVAQPRIPSGWMDWTCWQHSDAGTGSGILGPVDLNWFHGTRAELDAFVNLGQVP